jgi:thiamine transporter
LGQAPLPRDVRADRQRVAAVAEVGVVIALAVALGNVRILDLPYGGSVSFGSIPLLALALVRGPRRGAVCALGAGVLHALFGGTVVHPVQFVLDYGVGYAALATAGLVGPGSRTRIALACLVGGLAQLIVFTVSGAIYFATYLPEGLPLMQASLYYNAAHVLPETALAMWALPVVIRGWARSDPEVAAVLR